MVVVVTEEIGAPVKYKYLKMVDSHPDIHLGYKE